MRLAIIDLGTNSVRFDVHHLSPNHKTKALYREKQMVRLGHSVFLNGRLDLVAIQRTVSAFVRFKKICNGYKVNQIIALGTSALREAKNSEQLVKKVFKETGINLKVISGLEEARLISLGILINDKIPRGRFGLIDIGGGSTEVCLCKGRKCEQMQSFLLGTARLQQRFLKKSPPTQKNIDRLRKCIRKELNGSSSDWPKMHNLIGSSGTVRVLSKILKNQKSPNAVRLHGLSKLVQKMSTMNTSDLLEIPGMEFKRVDMVLSGAILLEECMVFFKVKQTSSSEYSLRDGVLAEFISQIA